jgi:tetratricopeptide (TPR) repeat protein
MIARRSTSRRSDPSSRWSCLGLAVIVPLSLWSLWGCGLVTVEHLHPGDPYQFEETELTSSALEKRVQDIDSHYAEPRDPEKVTYSLSIAEKSISSVNGYEALWRGMRACAWLAQNHRDRSERARYADLGLSMAQRARSIDKLSRRAETYYYAALCLGAKADLKTAPSAALVRELGDQARVAVAIDPRLDYCGGRRLLGMLIVKTADYPDYAMGTVDEGIRQLAKAVADCPDFPENHLFLAEALVEDGQYERARTAIAAVLASVPPPDHSVEHKVWLEKAQDLLASIPLDKEASVEMATGDVGLEGLEAAVTPGAGEAPKAPAQPSAQPARGKTSGAR